MTPQDITLYDDIREIKSIAAEAGAEGTWTLRGAKAVQVHMDMRDRRLSLDMADAGTILVIRFPATDGEEEGIEAEVA